VRATQVMQVVVSEKKSAAKSVKPEHCPNWVARTPAGHDIEETFSSKQSVASPHLAGL